MINAQEGLYTLYLRGVENGKAVKEKRLISCIKRCINPYLEYDMYIECAKNPDLRYIVCNTTEAGIVFDPRCKQKDRPASSYPGKLTQFMHERFCEFGKQEGKGFVILSCELIDDNGKELKKCVLQYANQWELGDEFIRWIEEENIFCSTLVDRIVSGYPRTEADQLNMENGYEDHLINTGEVFGLWVIEGPASLKKELPFEEAGLPVIITDDHKLYKQRKVRILNGAHTSMVLGAYLAGQDKVRECMEDEVIKGFMIQTVFEEIIPTLSLPEEELKIFALAVIERFMNPFIDHSLLAIALNSTAKWKARVLPSLKGYVEQYGILPKCIVASLAFYIAFYSAGEARKDGIFGIRKMDEYQINDDINVLEFFTKHKGIDENSMAKAVLSNQELWGEDLAEIPHLEKEITWLLQEIKEKGSYAVMRDCLER